MTPALAIRSARQRAGLSKRELAKRAATSPASIVLYEAGAREPTVPTLQRIVAATGHEVELSLTSVVRPDPERAGRVLAEVLELAERLPRRAPVRDLAYPQLPR